MSLTAQVVAIVARMGRCTINDIEPQLPAYRRDQIQKALENCARRGVIRQVKAGSGGNWGGRPGTWEIGDGRRVVEPKPAFPRVSSVWDLGAALSG